MQSANYNLRPVKKDTIYDLLPYVIRAADPRSAIRAYMEAVASEHNYFLGKLETLPRLQDPTKAAEFTPESFGESQTDFKRYQELATQSSPLTLADRMEMENLKAKVPKSVAAGAFEKVVLALLGDAVGADLHGRYDANANRQLIKTAIYRHHIKGTHGSVYILGRILGFLDLKVRELWTRFTIKDPAFPNARKNDDDFSDVPEQYPYWPRNRDNLYDGKTTLQVERTDGGRIEAGLGTYILDETTQLPLGDPSYSPMVLNDGPQDYTVTFEQLEVDRESSNFWNISVNDHNPFGNFKTDVLVRPVLGAYYLTGGDFINPSKVTIPLQGGGSVVFEALVPGEWANAVQLLITADFFGTTRLQMTGPQSKIKFKSSYFDLSLASDILIFPTLFKPVPVVPNDSASMVDLVVTENTSYDILGASSAYLDSAYPLLTLESVEGLTVGSVVEVNGIPSLNGRRTIIEINHELPGIVIRSYPGPLTQVDVQNVVPALEASINLVLLNANWAQVGMDIAIDGFGLYEVTAVVEDTVTIVNYGRALEAPGTVIPEGTQVTGPSLDMSYDDDFDADELPQVTFGRLAGDLPITGSVTGEQSIALETQTALNFQLYLELIATLRDLFEHIRPITRTPRSENYGFLLRDTMPYAPVVTTDVVILESLAHHFFLLQVDKFGSITWKPVNSGPGVEVIQTDNLTRTNYLWTITDTGDFLAELLPVSTVAVETNIVYVKLLEFTGFIYLENRALKSSSSSPEVVVNSIHGDGTTDESGVLGTNKALVYEDISALAAYVSADAVVASLAENKPDPTFIFQTTPEDDLTIILTATESIRTIFAANYKESSDLDFLDDVSMWHYGLDGGFFGVDPRLRATGGDPNIVEPIPTGDAGRQDGLFYNYPVQFADYSGSYLWRSRSTNRCYESHYTYASPDVNTGALRVDTEIHQDGQIEGAAFYDWTIILADQGFGPTPNLQAWGGASPNLDHLWQATSTRFVVLPSTSFTEASISGSGTCLLVQSLGSMQAGSIIKIVNSTLYNEVFELRNVLDASHILRLQIPSTFMGDDHGDIWVRLVDMQAWNPTTLRVTVEAGENNPSTDGVLYRVFVDDVQILDGKLGYDPADTATLTGGAVTKNSLVATCVSTAALLVGMILTASGIPAGTTVVSITNSTTFVMSTKATVSGASLTIVGRFAPLTAITNTTAVVCGAGSLAYVEVRGSGAWGATLENPEAPVLISGDGITRGALLMGGGSRDALEVTILPTTGAKHFGDYCEDISNFATVNGLPSWRGGAWGGTSVYSAAARTGLPAILAKGDDGL